MIVPYTWNPIEPLRDEDISVDLTEIENLHATWLEYKASSLAESDELKKFNAALNRRWSIETGIIERIYDLDRGVTETMVRDGFLAGEIAHTGGSKTADEVRRILYDHLAGIDMIFDYIKGERELSVGFMHQLHTLLLRNQRTVAGTDQFGHPAESIIEKGVFKKHPNNPTRPDGIIHEYCPPIQVQSEVERLLQLLHEYASGGIFHPIAISAWFHHRFAQIHPYQDGNGRLARVLSNALLIKKEYFPIVVTRDERTRYIDALEAADRRDINPLIELFIDIQKRTIREALSLTESPEGKTIESLAFSITSRIQSNRKKQETNLRKVNTVATGLRNVSRRVLGEYLDKIIQQFRADLDFHLEKAPILLGGPDQTIEGQTSEHWYRADIINIAREKGIWVNFQADHYFIRARLTGAGIPWLTFIVSFHHVGRDLSGTMEAMVYAFMSVSPEEKTRITMDYEPFTFTYKDIVSDLEAKFVNWLETAFIICVNEWGNNLQ